MDHLWSEVEDEDDSADGVGVFCKQRLTNRVEEIENIDLLLMEP